MRTTAFISIVTLTLFAGGAQAAKPTPTGNLQTIQTTIENVRTTAYSAGASHNGKHANKNAVGGSLQSGSVRSAAADWSKWPLGTRFRVRETGQEYVVDDIGRAMVGTGTIDLFKPREGQVWQWGVRRVTIDVIEWGSAEKSLQILAPRTKHRHVRTMVEALRNQIQRDSG